MTAEEFDNKLDIMLHNDELSPSEIIINVRQMREAYAEQRIKELEAKDIIMIVEFCKWYNRAIPSYETTEEEMVETFLQEYKLLNKD